MEQNFVALFAEFGVYVVVVSVVLDQAGLPVPAIPTLILAGAIAANTTLSVIELFLSAVVACVVTEFGWYLAGRWYGAGVMKLLCRISISPDSCVSETQIRFERWGWAALVVANFIPGLSIIAPPLAGATHMKSLRFLLYSTLGGVIWVGATLSTGMLLRPQIAHLLPRLQWVGLTVIVILVTLLATYIAYKWHQRRRFYAQLRMARIDVTELYQLIEAGAAPLIVDVRSATAHALEPRTIPGALRIPLTDIDRHLTQLPREREIVLYCTCPNEASAAQVAKVLLTQGFKRVRPLQGGLDAWIAAGYAAATSSTPGSTAVVSVIGA